METKHFEAAEFINEHITDKDEIKWYKGIFSRNLRQLCRQAELKYNIKISYINIWDGGRTEVFINH